jgi:sugar phosphate permease
MRVPGRWRPWQIVGLAFASQNVSIGLIYGVFGIVVGALEQRIHLSRAQSSFGVGIMLLSLGICSPLAGAVLGKRSVRGAIVLALMVESASLILLAYASSYLEYLAAFVFLGVSMCVAGVISPFLLITRWFQHNRALALGIVNIPLLLAVVPLLAGMAERRLGTATILWAAACVCMLVAVAVFAMITDTPNWVGGNDAARTGLDGAKMHAHEPRRSFVWNRQFWLLAFGVGILNGAGTAFLGHIVPFATERHFSLESASKIVFVYGSAGIAGALPCGWFADRVGAVKELIIIALVSAVIWIGFLCIDSFGLLLLLAALFGSFNTSLVAINGAAIAELFKPDEVARIAGLSFFVQLPLIFGLTPALGMLHDILGRYAGGFEFIVFMYLLAFALLVSAIWVRKPR